MLLIQLEKENTMKNLIGDLIGALSLFGGGYLLLVMLTV